MLSIRDPPQTQEHTQNESERLEKLFHANRDQKKEVIATLIPDKIDFKIKNVRRDKEGHYIMIRGIIQEDIMMINTYALNTRAPQNIRQMLATIKGGININAVIVGDFNTLLTPMDRSSRQKINKEAQHLNDTLHKLDLN